MDSKLQIFCNQLDRPSIKEHQKLFRQLKPQIQDMLIDYSRKIMNKVNTNTKLYKRALYIFQLSQVVNVNVNSIRPKYNNFQEWQNDPNNIYIGRNVFYVKAPLSKWHNPYPEKKYGREESIRMYKDYITSKLERDESLRKELLTLKDKNLGCWCKPESCHGDILVELINTYLNK